MKKMLKRILAGILISALVFTGAYEGILYLRNKNQTTVPVVKVDSIADSYYMPSSTLDGTITSNVTQEIKIDKDVVIEEVHVEKGQSVSKGDLLITFDNTLLEMELNIAKLKKQKQEQDLATAQRRLTSLQNGGPVEASDGTGVNADAFPGSDSAFDMSMVIGNGSIFLASVLPNVYFAEQISGDPGEDLDASDPAGERPFQQITHVQDQSVINDGSVQYLNPDDILSSGMEDEQPDPQEPGEILDSEDLGDGVQHFYRILDEHSIPFAGTGTELDPYVFLCTKEEGVVTLRGSFFNWMAGYRADGSEVVHKGGYWFRLEFHANDTVADPENRLQSCEAYYLIDGSLLENAVQPEAEVDLTVEDAIPYTYAGWEEDPGDYYGTQTQTGALTRAEAIKIQQMRISSLNLDLKDSDIKISKLEKKAAVTQITSRLDGVVSYLGDASTGTSIGEDFMKIQSAEGYFLRGSVSELMRDQVTVGTRLSCNGYESGFFEAEVIEVADYPNDSSSGGWSDSNPNVSYYNFTASILGENTNVSTTDWITINIEQEEDGTEGIVLSKALVRSENGVSYVYKDDHGVLKKQVVKVKEIVNSGYSVLIGGGLSREDKIAFPYSSSAEEGVKTVDATVDEFYGY